MKIKPILIISFSLGLILSHSSCGKVQGCNNPNADNYNSNAEEDDGSCILGRAKFIDEWSISGTLKDNTQTNTFSKQTCKITTVEETETTVNIEFTLSNLSAIYVSGTVNGDTLKVTNQSYWGTVYNGTLVKTTGDNNIYIHLKGISNTNTVELKAQGPSK